MTAAGSAAPKSPAFMSVAANIVGDYDYREGVSVWFRGIFRFDLHPELMGEAPLGFQPVGPTDRRAAGDALARRAGGLRRAVDDGVGATGQENHARGDRAVPTGVRGSAAQRCLRARGSGGSGVLHVIPMNYAVADETIVLRTEPGSVLARHGTGTEVAFEIDQVDHAAWRGWSVVARGVAEIVSSAEEIERIERVWNPRPWAAGERSSYVTVPWRRAPRTTPRDGLEPPRLDAGAPHRPIRCRRVTGGCTDQRSATRRPLMFRGVSAMTRERSPGAHGPRR